MRGAFLIAFLLLCTQLLSARDEAGSADTELRLSPVEELYTERYRGVRLRQFGYEIFGPPLPQVTPPASVDDGYLVGPGDQLILYLWGDPVEVLNLESVYTLEVDREGRIFLPHTGVLYVHGRTLKGLKELLRRQLSRKFRRLRVEVSLGRLRSFPVYVTGAVRKPGIVLAQGTHTVLDVLFMAGGIRREGSLRRIALTRRGPAGEERLTVDLYSLLAYGGSVDLRVREGDLIHVPPVGRTAGIAGAVKRPAIYELTTETTLSELLELAGGILPSAYPVVKILRYEDGGVRVYESSLNGEAPAETPLRDGDLVVVEEIYGGSAAGAVRVEGHVAYPGSYAPGDTGSLRELLPKVGLLPDTNMHYAELIRREPPDYRISVIPFSPLRVLEGEEDIRLRDLDRVRFFPRWINPPIQISGEVESPSVIPYHRGITLLEVLRDLKFRGDIGELKAVIYRSVEGTGGERRSAFGELPEGLTPRDLEDLRLRLEEELVYIRRLRGDAENDELARREEEIKNRLAAIERRLKGYGEFGGIFASVYLLDLLFRGKGNVELMPGDRVVVRRTEVAEKDRVVTLLGEVRKPGIYRLEEGMTLYDLLVKAGGYTPRAYPKGLIFIRESAKRLQREHIETALTTLEETLLREEEGTALAGASPEERQLLEFTLRRQRELLNLIKTRARLGLGRIALEVPEDLEELRESPSNIPLEDGDYVYVPARPSYVLVIGGVYNQISLPYVEGRSLSFYLEQVGGLTEAADLENLYVIKANGRVVSKRSYSRPLSFEWRDRKLYFVRDFLSMPLEEGDTVVVPTELRIPIMWRPLVRDVVQIIFQAISTAVLAKRL